MRYIAYFVLALIVTILGLYLMYRWSHTIPVKDYVIRVNGKLITASEFSHQLNRQPVLLGGSANYAESLVTRELLIQEAKRQKIDQEEPFRQALKNFYEQSLIKILVDRKMRSITYTPTPEEISAYKKLSGRKVTFILTSIGNMPNKARHKGAKGNVSNELTDLFDNIALPIRISMLFLKPGEKSGPVNILGGRYVIELKRIGPPIHTNNKVSDDEIVSAIREYRREEIFKKWLDKLRKNAKVEIHTKNIEIKKP